MTVIAGIAIAAEDFDIGQALSATKTRIELTQFVPVNGQLVPYFWKEHGGDSDEFEAAVRANERVASLTNLDGRVDAHLYRIEWNDVNGFLTALHDNDIMVEEGRTSGDGTWFFRLRAPTKEELSSFQSTCFDASVHLDIRRVYHNPSASFGRADQLSEEQHEALLLAIRSGYFEIPRGRSQEELAADLGISRQAFSRRLKRAQNNLFKDLYWSELADT